MLTREGPAIAVERNRLGRSRGEKRAARTAWLVTIKGDTKANLEEGLRNVGTGRPTVTLPETVAEAKTAAEQIAAAAALTPIPKPTAEQAAAAKEAAAVVKAKARGKAAGALLPIGLALGFALLKG